MPPDPTDEEIRKQRAKIAKAFEDLAEATTNLTALAKKQIELMNKQITAANQQSDVMNGLIESLMMPKDGMRDVLDEVLGEIQGLRDDIRVLAQSGGFQSVFAALMGRKPRG
jgi:uncharacterized protein Yka (UPF0111/DUF47 family)